MDAFVTTYTNLALQATTLLQRLGLATIPIGIAIAALINWLGGERAIRAVGVALLVMGILAVILTGAVTLSKWMQGLLPAPGTGLIVFWF
jgi:hypothetical protein